MARSHALVCSTSVFMTYVVYEGMLFEHLGEILICIIGLTYYFQGSRKALNFGSHKINLHEHGNELEPKAQWPQPGSADVCFITNTKISDVIDHLKVSYIL